MSKPKVKVRNCPICGIKYKADLVRLSHGRQVTCSRKCSYKFRGAAMDRSVLFSCANCGSQFKRSPSQIKSKHKAVYCSKRCHYTGRTLGITPRIVDAPYVITDAGAAAQKEARKRAVATRNNRGNYRHTKATRERLAHATASNIASGKIKRVSKIEDVVSEELARQGVPHTRQVGIRGDDGRFAACVDFMVGSKTVIEVNGTFWHADNRFYPDRENLSPSQRRTVERYCKKIDLLAKRGLNLIEIWEHDLSECCESAVSNAVRRIV